MNAKQAARMAQKAAAAEAAQKKFDFDEYAELNPDFNLIPKDQVAQIKDLLKKEHRTEDDWTIIKDILQSHAVIVTEPVKPDRRIKVRNHILCEEGNLIVFTNGNDCQRYTKEFILKNLPASTLFQMGSMPFTMAVDIAEKHRMDLLIDPVSAPGDRFMMYVHGKSQIKAVMLG